MFSTFFCFGVSGFFQISHFIVRSVRVLILYERHHMPLLCIMASLFFIKSCYCKQRSCGKVMFSQASVILFTGGRGVFLSGRPPGQRSPLDRDPLWTGTPWTEIPLDGDPPKQRLPPDRDPADTAPPNTVTSGWYASY